MNHFRKIKEKSFSYISLYIQNDDVINETKQFLDQRNISASPKVVLSSYLIHSCPDEILSTERSPLEETLVQKSKELIETIEDESMFEIQDICDHYASIFDIWKKKDKETQLEIYLDLYDNYSKMKLPESKEIKEKLYQAIQLLAKDETDELISNFKQKHQTRTVQASLLFQIEKQMKQLYWKQKENLGVYDTKQILEWLQDAQTLFHTIYDLLKYSKKEKDDFDQVMDLSFIQEQLQQNSYDLDKLLFWLLEKLKILDSAQYDTEYPSVYHMIREQKYVPVVRFILEHLETILNFIKFS